MALWLCLHDSPRGGLSDFSTSFRQKSLHFSSVPTSRWCRWAPEKPQSQAPAGASGRASPFTHMTLCSRTGLMVLNTTEAMAGRYDRQLVEGTGGCDSTGPRGQPPPVLDADTTAVSQLGSEVPPGSASPPGQPLGAAILQGLYVRVCLPVPHPSHLELSVGSCAPGHPRPLIAAWTYCLPLCMQLVSNACSFTLPSVVFLPQLGGGGAAGSSVTSFGAAQGSRCFRLLKGLGLQR